MHLSIYKYPSVCPFTDYNVISKNFMCTSLNISPPACMSVLIYFSVCLSVLLSVMLTCQRNILESLPPCTGRNISLFLTSVYNESETHLNELNKNVKNSEIYRRSVI